jgi:uncharacterized glyoxalase superfamily protein PhnB
VATDMATDWPPLYPHLAYQDPVEAIAWLTKAFGFREVVRMEKDGTFVTSKLEPPVSGLIMITRRNETYMDWLRQAVPDLPKEAKMPYPHLGHSISVLVEDVDAHFEHAKASGATILSEPDDQPWGLRVYAVLDPEGHQWEFVKPVKDLQPEAWGARRVWPAG